MEHYVRGEHSGNLLDLWNHIEKIGSTADSADGPSAYIDNRVLDGFLDWWFSAEGHRCACEECGVTCRYCNSFLARAIQAR